MSIQIAMRLSPTAGHLVRQAAELLRSYLAGMFGVQVDEHGDARQSIVIGRIEDAHVRAASADLPKLSAQGHLLRRVDSNTMLLAGGSDAATAWAVYELLERYGVRFLLSEDVLPTEPGPFFLPELDLVLEPAQKLRSWRVMCELPYGPLMWTLEDQKRFIGQLHKLKFNGLQYSIWPAQPFTHFEIDGVAKQTADTMQRDILRLLPDTPGYESLQGFGDPMLPPWMAGLSTYEDRLAAGQGLLHAIMDEGDAHEMHSSVGFQPMEVPIEFAPLLEDPTKHSIQLGALTCAEQADLMNPKHRKVFRAIMEAHLETWSRCDEFLLGLPEHPHAERKFEESWGVLAKRFGLEPRFNVEEMLDRAANDVLQTGGTDRAVREFKSSISMLRFIREILEETRFLDRAADKNIDVGLSVGSRFSYGILGEVLWPGCVVSTVLDYTPTASVRRLHMMHDIDTDKVNARAVLTFQDDNVGWVPTIEAESNHILLQTGHRAGWQGYTTRYWPIGDLDPAVLHVARSSWIPTYTPREAYVDYAAHAFGEHAVETFCNAMWLLTDATVFLDTTFLGFLFPVDEIITYRCEHPDPQQDRSEVHHVVASFQQVLRLFEEMHSAAHSEDAKRRLAYWIGRLEFSIHAILEIIEVNTGQQSLAKAKEAPGSEEAGKLLDEARACYERGISEGRAAVEAVAPVTVETTDRAAVGAYHHFLVRQVEAKVREIFENISNTT
jgi:hypothetical protein